MYFRSVSFVFVLLLVVPQALGQTNINGVFENLSVDSRLVEGDIFKAKITILPLLAAIPSEFRKKLEGKVFLDYFKVLEVDSTSFSENNSEVFEITLIAVLEKSFSHKDFIIWSYKGLNIPFTFKNIRTDVNSSKNKSYLIHDQILENLNKNLKKYIILTLVLSMTLGFYFYRKRKKSAEVLRGKKDKQKKHRRWKEAFKSANSRSDYEKIVCARSEWKEFVVEKRQELDLFISEVEENMYKKDWDSELLERLNNQFSRCENILGEKWK